MSEKVSGVKIDESGIQEYCIPDYRSKPEKKEKTSASETLSSEKEEEPDLKIVSDCISENEFKTIKSLSFKYCIWFAEDMTVHNCLIGLKAMEKIIEEKIKWVQCTKTCYLTRISQKVLGHKVIYERYKNINIIAKAMKYYNVINLSDDVHSFGYQKGFLQKVQEKSFSDFITSPKEQLSQEDFLTFSELNTLKDLMNVPVSEDILETYIRMDYAFDKLNREFSNVYTIINKYEDIYTVNK